MFRMSKASIISSSICTEQVGMYNVHVIVGSLSGVVRCVNYGLACGGYGSAVRSVVLLVHSSTPELRTGHATLTTDPTADPYPPHAKPELIRSALHHTTIQLSHAHCTYRPAR